MAVEAPNIWVPDRSTYYFDNSLTEEQVRCELDSLRRLVISAEVPNRILEGPLNRIGPRFANMPHHKTFLYHHDINAFNPPNRH